MNLLVIEDDTAIGRSLHKGFVEAGHECSWAKNGRTGLERALSQQFDAIILDLLLPELPGLTVLRQIRASGVRTPVLLLTALGAVEERVEGLNAGADDYLVKPFAFAELAARLAAVCRRAGDRPTAVVKAGELFLDLATRHVYRNDQEIEKLTPIEFRLLEMLLRHAGQVVTRKMLCQHIWEDDWEGTTNVIDVHVNRLRNKIDRPGEESLIQTVRGRGYALRA
jgi:two-component system OmpR family response regulator/two-component system copper resistance phosphate regulon response regulator CusR